MDDEDYEQFIESMIRRVDVPVKAVLGKSVITVNDFVNIQVGDIIRLDSKDKKKVHFVTYEDSVEQNLMALVLTKERLNEFIKCGEVKEQAEIFNEFDISLSVIDSLLRRETDAEGKVRISWGRQLVT